MSSTALATRSNISGQRVAAPVRHSVAPVRSAAVYERRRLGIVAAAVICATVGVLIASTRFADAGDAVPTGAGTLGIGTVVIAQPGDTLWSLAREVQPDGDVRPLVARLARSHGGSALRAGDRIVLPAR